MKRTSLDISEVLEIYAKKLAAFKREMKALGIKVKVTASIGPFSSIVEVVNKDGKEVESRP